MRVNKLAVRDNWFSIEERTLRVWRPNGIWTSYSCCLYSKERTEWRRWHEGEGKKKSIIQFLSLKMLLSSLMIYIIEYYWYKLWYIIFRKIVFLEESFWRITYFTKYHFLNYNLIVGPYRKSLFYKEFKKN